MSNISTVFMTENMIAKNKKSLKISKEVIRIHKLKKDGQHNGKSKTTNNNLQKNTQKTKDRETRTPPRTGHKLMCSGRVGSSCTTSDTCHASLVTDKVINNE